MAQLVFELKAGNSFEQKFVPLLKRSARQRRSNSTATPHHALSGSHSFAEILFELGQGLLGTLFLLLGMLLTLTLWLLPVGVPLALLGCALIATQRDKV